MVFLQWNGLFPVTASSGRTRMEPPAATPAASPIEGLGIFYLGRRVDPASGEPTPEPLLLDARRLTTHAVCVGMTGSGKTGLLVGLLEEAALDGIPAVVIDPKGDLTNLLLSFPDLAPADFLPWVDPAVARREGIEPAELAARTAAQWRQGLEASGQTADRIARLRAAAEMADVPVQQGSHDQVTEGDRAHQIGRGEDDRRSHASPPSG